MQKEEGMKLSEIELFELTRYSGKNEWVGKAKKKHDYILLFKLPFFQHSFPFSFIKCHKNLKTDNKTIHGIINGICRQQEPCNLILD